MTQQPSFEFNNGNVAVITGGADGIGLAAAKKFCSLGMKVCIADLNEEALESAASELDEVMIEVVDVTNLQQMTQLKEKVYERYGRVDVLMNNAGIVLPAGSWDQLDNWKTMIDVNLLGVIHGIHCFSEAMIRQKTPGLIINTGSKQGITSPPGNPCYNTTKAALKVITETLQHSLRNEEDCQINAKLLVPGFTYTGMVRKYLPEKPASAWTAEQVVEFMMERVQAGDFYIICPDNDADRELDNKRMEWAMGDIIHNRSPLSRWDPDYKDEYEAFILH